MTTVSPSTRYALCVGEAKKAKRPEYNDTTTRYQLVAKLCKIVRPWFRLRPSLYAAHSFIAFNSTTSWSVSWRALSSLFFGLFRRVTVQEAPQRCDALLYYSSAKPGWQPAMDALAEELSASGFAVTVMTPRTLTEQALSTIANIQAFFEAVLDTVLLTALLVQKPRVFLIVFRNPLSVFHQLLLSHQRASVVRYLLRHANPRLILINSELVPYGAELATVKVPTSTKRVLFFGLHPLPCFSGVVCDEVWVWNEKARKHFAQELLPNVNPRIEIIGRPELDFLIQSLTKTTSSTPERTGELHEKRTFLFLAEALPGDAGEMEQRDALAWLALASIRSPNWVFIYKHLSPKCHPDVLGMDLITHLSNWVISSSDSTLSELISDPEIDIVAGLSDTTLSLAPALKKMTLRLLPADNAPLLPLLDDLTIPIHSPTELYMVLDDYDSLLAQYQAVIAKRLNNHFPHQNEVLKRMKTLALNHLNGKSNEIQAEKGRKSMTPQLPANVDGASRQIDILFLIEHISRELDVACAIKALAERERNLRVEIKHVYHDVPAHLSTYLPRVVVFPSFYCAEDLANKDYITRWQESFFFNMAWEEIFYQGHMKLKAPADEFTRTNVIHHAWGNFYRDYLMHYGVQESQIFVNGNPAYQLYRKPYRDIYIGRNALAQKYGLDPNKRWIFVPENYRWAFITDSTIDWRVSQGADRKELKRMRAYAQSSLKELLRWCNNVAQNNQSEVIFRPKPATRRVEMENFFREHLDITPSATLHIEKGESVREWILASDITVSSFSTTLIEAAIAGKEAAMVEPLPLTEEFQADWYNYVPKISSESEFIQICQGEQRCDMTALSTWAEQEMLANGDPIARCAEFLNLLVEEHRKMVPQLSPLVTPPKLFRQPSAYFNLRTHENDIFGEREVEERSARLKTVLGISSEAHTSLSEKRGGEDFVASIVICTYNRAPLLKKCLQSLMQQSFQGPEIEVIVVDNNSTDNTAEVVREYINTFPFRLRYEREDKQGLSYTRNRGYEVADGTYLVYLDDDALAPEHYLSEILRVIEKHQPDILGGPLYPYYTSSKPAWFQDNFEIRKWAENSGFSTKCNVTGANFTIRREVLKQLGLFDPGFQMVAGEIGLLDERKVLELYRARIPKQEQKVYYSLECFIHHHTAPSKMSLLYIVKRGAAAGGAASRLFFEVRGKHNWPRVLHHAQVGATVVSRLIEETKKSGFSWGDEQLSSLVLPLRDSSWSIAYVLAAVTSKDGSVSSSERQSVSFGILASGDAILKLKSHLHLLSEVNRSELEQALYYLERQLEELRSQFEIGEVLRQCPDYNEEVYLAQNPDVEAAVCAGQCVSGLQHFVQVGHREDRIYRKSDRDNTSARTSSRDVDVLWLVEHVSRELDVACAVGAYLEQSSGLKFEVKSFTYHINDVLRRSNPRVVCFPHFYTADEQAIAEYVTRWPSSVFVNLAWEEIFFNGQMKIKAPVGEVAKQKVMHHAWGEFYSSYLGANGVNSALIFANGNPALQLYQPGYREFYQSRAELAARYGLDPNKRWVFIPENYDWAFSTDERLQHYAAQGGDYDEMLAMRTYAQLSFAALLEWCELIAREGTSEIIVRPKPATAQTELLRFYREAFLTEQRPSFRINKEESAREWILASDIVISSLSTTLIEGAICGKPVFMVEPLPLIESFQASWQKYLPRIKTADEFRRVCEQGSGDNGAELRKWAISEMLSAGDPIVRLAQFLMNLVQQHRQRIPAVRETVNDEPLAGIPYCYHNSLVYEKDSFNENDVKKRIRRWKKILKLSAPSMNAAPMETATVCASIIICTYNRASLLEKCLESIAAQSYRGSDIQVVVIDNNSSDRTAELVRKRAASFPFSLRYVNETQQGLSYARNRGYEVASGRYLVYLDDDATIPPDYVSELRQIILQHQPDLIGGPVYPYYADPKADWFLDKFEIRKYADRSGFSETCSVSGGNFTIRRALLEQLGLFDPKYGMNGNTVGLLEERKVLELYRASRKSTEQKIYYSLECFIEHYTPASKMTLAYILNRSVASGAAASQMFHEVGKKEENSKALTALMEGANTIAQLIAKGSPLLSELVLPLKQVSEAISSIRATFQANEQAMDLGARLYLLFRAVAVGKQMRQLKSNRQLFSESDFRELSAGLECLEPSITYLNSALEQYVSQVLARHPDFDEESYLTQNPDIEAAVYAGSYVSGLEHFVRGGHLESRLYRSSDRAKVTAATRARDADVLWLVEHVDRELDVACAVRAYLQGELGIGVEIKGLTYHINDYLRRSNPRVVCLPYCYSTADDGIREVVNRWPESFFVNLAWEEIFFKGHLKIKAPADDETRNKIIHHAWGEFYREYLVSHGVNHELIFMNGNPVYQLYQPPYRDYYPARSDLAGRYNLDPNKKWVLIPENYRWAFLGDDIIEWRTRQGANREEMLQMRMYAQLSLAKLLQWCQEISQEGNVEIIVRPKPATSSKEMARFYHEAFLTEAKPNFRIMKNESVREWILASDVIISSFSTTLIEAAMAGKSVFMVEPLPLTESFQSEWYQFLPQIKTIDQFRQACNLKHSNNGEQLREWATKTMLSNGDPVLRLAGFLCNLVEDHRANVPSVSNTVNNEVLSGLPYRYFSMSLYEKDIFSDSDVEKRTKRWKATLGIEEATTSLQWKPITPQLPKN